MKIGRQLQAAIDEIAENAAWSLAEKTKTKDPTDAYRGIVLGNAIRYILRVNGMGFDAADAYARQAVAKALYREQERRKIS
jgi:hypothetical protein